MNNDARPSWWAMTSGGSGFGYGWSRYGFCSCNRANDQYGCSLIPQIKLPGRNVDPDSIDVLVDGTSFSEFALQDGYKLVRTDGNGWPCCQNLLKATTEVGTWQVTYDYGLDPPVGGKMAAAVLGSQLYLTIPDAPGTKNIQTQLPKRVTSITRQGITLAVIDPLKLFADGLTGLPFVDLWVASDRLGGARRRATVLTPGRARRVRRDG